MAFKAKIQCTIHAPLHAVWDGLTLPEQVKKYFFDTELITSWEPGSPVYFRGEWEGKPYEDKGTVLHYEPQKVLAFNYFSSWSDLPDRPENYQVITYRVKPKGSSTILTIVQSNIDTLEKKLHSAQNWKLLAKELKKLLE